MAVQVAPRLHLIELAHSVLLTTRLLLSAPAREPCFWYINFSLNSVICHFALQPRLGIPGQTKPLGISRATCIAVIIYYLLATETPIFQQFEFATSSGSQSSDLLACHLYSQSFSPTFLVRHNLDWKSRSIHNEHFHGVSSFFSTSSALHMAKTAKSCLACSAVFGLALLSDTSGMETLSPKIGGWMGGLFVGIH